MSGPEASGGERLSSRDRLFTRGGFHAPPPIGQTERPMGVARRLLDRLRPEWRVLTLTVVAVTVSAALTVLGPRLLGEATDVVVGGLISQRGIDFGELQTVLLWTGGVYASSALLAWLGAHLLAGVVQRTMFRLRRDVEEKIHRLPLAYVDGTSRGDLLSRATNDIDNVAQSLQMTTSQLLSQLLLLVGMVVMMVTISPLLAVLSVVLVPTSIVIVRVVGTRSRNAFASQWRHTGELNGIVEETFAGHQVVKVFGQQDRLERDFQRVNDELYLSSTRAQFVVGVVQPTMMLLGNLNYVVIAVLGGLRISSGAMSVGDIQAFFQYSRQFTQPLTMLSSMLNMVQSGLASADRVFELLQAPEEAPDPTDEVTPDPGAGLVAFDHVSFRYVAEQPLIDDLSFVAEPGETIAIVGPTGAGKTTLVNLLMRFYEIDGGSITLDGLDIRSLSRGALRARVGMVLQDTWLFEGSIRENIRYGRLDATDDEVVAAAQAAHVDHFVHTLPDGYDTVIDEDGGNLSAGEKQLLTIARAFLADPGILVLDEATSSVDTRTEVLVQQAMAAVRSRRTCFVIAHRLSTIRDADRILMVDGGAIVEQGTHDELSALGGAYFTLYQTQLRREERAPEAAPA